MSRTSRLTSLVASLSLAAFSACGDAAHPMSPEAIDAAPAPGRLMVSLDGANAGGVLLILRGAGITEPTVLESSRELFSGALDSTGTAYRVAIVGDRVTGRLFSFAVPDVNRLESYTVTLVQVADQANSLLESLEGYKLSVQRQKE